MTAVAEPDLDLILLEDFEPEVECESPTEREQGVPTHGADWYMRKSVCGHVTAVCDKRRREIERDARINDLTRMAARAATGLRYALGTDMVCVTCGICSPLEECEWTPINASH